MSRELDPDDHLVEPGTRCEVFEGEIVYVPPARPGHGDIHSLLNTVIGHHTAQPRQRLRHRHVGTPGGGTITLAQMDYRICL